METPDRDQREYELAAAILLLWMLCESSISTADGWKVFSEGFNKHVRPILTRIYGVARASLSQQFGHQYQESIRPDTGATVIQIPNLSRTIDRYATDLYDTFRRRYADIQVRRQDAKRQAEIEPEADPVVVPEFGQGDAERIAVTTTTQIQSHGELDGARDVETRVGQRLVAVWRTEPGACFVAGTLIETSRGPVPIEQVLPGDLVFTRSGYRSVLACQVTEYQGAMRTVQSGNRSVTCTANHQFMSEEGWLNALNLNIGDGVYSLGDKYVRISRVRDFQVGDPNNLEPSRSLKVASLPCIPGSVLMPVNSVNLQCNSEVMKQEVNGVSTKLNLLRKSNAEAFESNSRDSLRNCLPAVLAVAGKATKPFIRLVWHFAKPLLAVVAACENRWSVAGFRAVLARPPINLPRLSPKYFSAPHALSPCSNFLHALDAMLATLVGVFKLESLFARLALDCLGCGRSAFPSAVNNRLLSSPRAEIEQSPALQTVFVDSAPLAIGSGESEFKVSRRQGSILVYDLQVEEAPEFFANGFLVHNCKICSPLDGTITEWRLQFPNGPAAHPNCRCYLDWRLFLD